jgi:hypothetical protein
MISTVIFFRFQLIGNSLDNKHISIHCRCRSPISPHTRKMRFSPSSTSEHADMATTLISPRTRTDTLRRGPIFSPVSEAPLTAPQTYNRQFQPQQPSQPPSAPWRIQLPSKPPSVLWQIQPLRALSQQASSAQATPPSLRRQHRRRPPRHQDLRHQRQSTAMRRRRL